jgi:serine/threonine protein kinase
MSESTSNPPVLHLTPLNVEASKKPSSDEPSEVPISRTSQIIRENDTFHIGLTPPLTPQIAPKAGVHLLESLDGVSSSKPNTTLTKSSSSPKLTKIPSSAWSPQFHAVQSPFRVDTDDDLMQKGVNWEIDAREIDFTNSVIVGKGAYGEVMKAKWRGTIVAVKRVHVGTNASSIKEIRHEIAVMSLMHHPRVTQFLGACTRSQPWLIVFEYMSGGALSTLLEKRNGRLLKYKVAGRFSIDCARGLRYLHEHKPDEVVHRDLKPNNLLISSSGHCKISDFGLAKVLDIVKERDEAYVMTGETGSYRYMAPEVFRHEKYSCKVDIYAFGMIMYYLFHGKPPFYELNPLEAAKTAALRNVRPRLNPQLPSQLRALIACCWHSDPAQRPSAKVVYDTLEELFPDVDMKMDIEDEGCCCVG